MLVPGRNCWRIERAHRVAFLVDGAAYFAAVRAAIAGAERSVFILGWDIDSRARLVPGEPHDGYPAELGELLQQVVARRPALRVYILTWDFAMIFAGDREGVAAYKLGWRTEWRPRLHFQLDSRHPFAASHHQKVVVVDDAVAFVGGMDLTHGRWDTPAHRPAEPARCDARGRPAGPVHDVQAAVDGDAARALGALCRDRWARLGKATLPAADEPADRWPPDVVPDITDVDVAIARTEPGWPSWRPVEEIRVLYADVIAAARRSLYLENQYFSSRLIGAALLERLAEPDPPDIVVVSRMADEGWLEKRTMGALRLRLHRRLKAVDAHGRYGLFYPRVHGPPGARLLNVHSKVMVMDDELCSVGSANLSDRSMGFDTECNLLLEARGEPRVRRAIAGLRDRLLAEHLDVPQDAVARTVAAHGGRLLPAIEALQGGGRTLAPLQPRAGIDLGRLGVDALVDPMRPSEARARARQLVPVDFGRPLAARLGRLAAALLVGAALLLAWRHKPARK
jgi:phosphatidylserine/phosphatidylglycerophosphate/cardiolipin synthase-like enzyme